MAVRETSAPVTISPEMMAIDEASVEMPSVEVEKIAVIPFIEKLNATQTSAISVEMRKLTDTAAIRLPMSVKEMSIFIGSTQIQTQLVYGYAPGKAKKLTPLEYVHLLVDDLFQRKGLAGMISDEQRTLLGQRAYLMDLADKNASLTPKALNILLRAFGIEDFTDEELLAIANPLKPVTPIAKQPTEEDAAQMVSNLAQMQRSLQSTDTTRATIVAVQPKEKPAEPKQKSPSKADQQAELFAELVFGEKTYTSDQMAAKLARLMKLSDVHSDPVTPAQMSLLYDYYGSEHSSADTLKMGFGPLLNFLCDTLVYDPRIAELLPDSISAQAKFIKAQVQDGLVQLRT